MRRLKTKELSEQQTDGSNDRSPRPAPGSTTTLGLIVALSVTFLVFFLLLAGGGIGLTFAGAAVALTRLLLARRTDKAVSAITVGFGVGVTLMLLTTSYTAFAWSSLPALAVIVPLVLLSVWQFGTADRTRAHSALLVAVIIVLVAASTLIADQVLFDFPSHFHAHSLTSPTELPEAQPRKAMWLSAIPGSRPVTSARP